jgi:hypothetical protein
MKLPISFKDFAKDPVKGLLFIVLLAVGYLYYDNKASYQNMMSEYKEQVSGCETKVSELEKKVETQNARLKKSDSTMAVAVARLEVLNEINKMK